MGVKNNGSLFSLFRAKKPGRDIAALRRRSISGPADISKPHPTIGGGFVTLRGGNAMERDNISTKVNQSAERPTVIYVDGCKVTVRYSGKENPAAVKNIKDTLISSGTTRKS